MSITTSLPVSQMLEHAYPELVRSGWGAARASSSSASAPVSSDSHPNAVAPKRASAMEVEMEVGNRQVVADKRSKDTNMGQAPHLEPRSHCTSKPSRGTPPAQ